MAKVKSLRDPNRLFFSCPGCNEDHCVVVGGDAPTVWTYNWNPDAPTFMPSVLVTASQKLTEEEWRFIDNGGKIEPIRSVCHSFVADGRIQFLSDCTHELAGQTVDLPDWET